MERGRKKGKDLQMQKEREGGDENDEMITGRSTGKEENKIIKQIKKQKELVIEETLKRKGWMKYPGIKK